jgi:erythromycin esterase-like protein
MAAAGGPQVPQVLRDQLAIGGRLVMPVGSYPRHQQLKKITRVSASSFEEEDLGSVRFVPLIGEYAWPESDNEQEMEMASEDIPEEDALSRIIEQFAEPLPDISESFGKQNLQQDSRRAKHEEFARHFDRFAKSRVVLLGEASHGTAEFYRARAIITRRLIEEHGFNIVAVEADWPDAAMIDRYVRHRPTAHGSEPPFRRFPTWMWRNTEVEAFTEWLRKHNETLTQDQRAGFYGLDMYNLSGSITSILAYLDRVDPDAARIARERYGCLTPWQKDPEVYGRVVLSREYQKCEEEVVAQLRDLLEKRMEYAREDGMLFLDAAQNARLVASAERYYRTMYYGAAESWNLRDTHMFETLENILEAHGQDSKAVVWAHNSHIGNAAATDMGRVRGEVNIGQLCRERFGDEAALIGFGTYSGTVAAATDWDGPMEVKYVRPAREDSYEHLCHKAGIPRFLLDLRHTANEPLHRRLSESRLERFIGVIYRPETELQSHYAEASLSEQFDAYVWLDNTSAVTPLPTVQHEGVPETYPFGL